MSQTPQQSHESDPIIIPILEIRKLRLQKVNYDL